MIKVEWAYWLAAALFALAGLMRLRDDDAKRFGSGAFWILLAFTFVYGSWVVDGSGNAMIEGIAVIVLALLAGAGFPTKGSERTTSDAERGKLAERFGWKIFVPALLIPLVAVVIGRWGSNVKFGGNALFEIKQEALIGLAIGAIVALTGAMLLVRERHLDVPFREGNRLLGSIGWAAILPQFLATLGVLFTQAKIGDAVGDLVHKVLPNGQVFLAVVVYCVGMFVFTVIMGNAFAAFPVMTAAIGWPVLVQQFDGNPPAIFAVGMLAGFCGTLCTPMAANFNLVPAALLELKDQYGPIKAQIPTAIPLLACNIAIMYLWCIPR
ncbi:DUF979 domain-containing protein [Flexivirga meconopsidis]|uniref:DUF979 domain-containing protein n=1 Tax=Flexivirga meconopsidis TaxID=2977121 RepID=UPI00223FE610